MTTTDMTVGIEACILAVAAAALIGAAIGALIVAWMDSPKGVAE